MNENLLHTRLFLLLLLLVGGIDTTFSQCINGINTFPSTENFEINNGGWITGGQNSDWACGLPTKSVINSAASGTNCWIVGGLTGNSYAPNESSWIQSPCYDFSSLEYPYVSFNVFWECERQYDGASLQYSLDGGNRWNDIGNTSSNLNCLNSNWYNYSPIRFLSGLNNFQNGWSGNIQSTSGSCVGGNGSGGWVQAGFAAVELARRTNVIFRFVFGAGSTCNNFNGFAVDDFTVSGSPPNEASFIFACGDNNSVKFTNTSALCPTSFQWDFDDPLSGAQNFSSLRDPSHQFVGAGKHRVSLIVSSLFNRPDTFYADVNTISISAAVSKQIKCFGDSNGEITANTNGTTNPVSYIWNTNPSQSSSVASNLSAGTYKVTASAQDVCAVSTEISITEPSEITNQVSINQPGCQYVLGEAIVTSAGGTPSYTYNWSPTGGNNRTANSLQPGAYQVTVTDSKGCTKATNVDIVQISPPTVTIINKKDITCNDGKDGSITIDVSNASSPYSIRWSSAPLDTLPTVSNLRAGNYSVLVQDENYCKVVTNVTLTEPLSINKTYSITNTTCNLPNGKIQLNASGNYIYNWIPNVSSTNAANNILPGYYSVEIKDNAGCSVLLNDILLINEGVSPYLFLGNDTTICKGEKLVLYPGEFEKYLWQNNSVSPDFTVTQSGKYWVRVESSEGCTNADTINIQYIDNCTDLYFPSVFSPNNDGLNDTYGPVGNLSVVSNYELMIFNRWGEIVFKTKNPREKWRGNTKLSGPASFVWRATYSFNGQPTKVKQGSLTILP